MRWHVLIALGCLVLPAAAPADEPITPRDLAGTWAGTVEHDGETQTVALTFDSDTCARPLIYLSMPVVHLDHVAIARMSLTYDSSGTHAGPFTIALDRSRRTLRSVMPAALVPVDSLPLELHRVDSFAVIPRPAISAPTAKPVWTFESHAQQWAGPTFAGGALFLGGQDGVLHVLDARSGRERWTFRAGGPIRTRPTVAGDGVYVASDDGFLSRLDATTGTLRWRVKVVDHAIERLPFDNPKSRYDRFGSDVVAAGERLYLGTHDGKVLALRSGDGSKVWEFQAGDAVLAAPALAADRVVVGSYDKHVYALDRATGRRLWSRDTKGAVVSTPAIDGRLAIVGNRAYDLLALDLGDGSLRWKRYIWMSWVESSARIFDHVIYVGSSDAAAVFAFDAASGARRWATDVHGWAWGEPAVTETRVYTGVSSQVGYPAGHSAGALALDRRTGEIVWQAPSDKPPSGPYGYPGSPAVGAGLVFFADLAGRVTAYRL